MPSIPNGPTRGGLVHAAILGVLGTRGPSSRADLARLLGVSPATVTQVTKALLERHLITELESVPSAGGRPAILLGLDRAAGGAIGAKVTADHVVVVSVELDGTVRSKTETSFDPAAPDALDRLGDVLAAAVEAHEGRLLGVGVGVAGAIDALDSGVVDAPTLGWSRVPLGASLRARLGVPVLVDNDVNTLATAESVHGIGRDHTDYLVVTIGRGVGCGIVRDGLVVRGASGAAGEVGHIPVGPLGAEGDAGPRCGCGNDGCLEAYVGEDGILAAARAAGLTVATTAELAELARSRRAGHAAAATVFDTAGRLLGRTLAGVVHTLDPECVVLMGEGIGDWPLWQAGFDAALRRHLLPGRRDLPVLVEPWAEGQWAVGAACLVISAPFDANATGTQGEMVRARLQDAALTGPVR